MTYTKNKGRLILLFLLLFLTGCDLSPGGKELLQTESLEQTKEISDGEEQGSKAQIWVHVCGEVKNPGVYSLSAGSRVFDAIEAAGGFNKIADETSLNLAQSLEDESKIYVGSKKDKKSSAAAADTEDSSGKVNLNTATIEELMTLPGIGEVRAQAILDFREKNGSFQKVEDLLEVEGIKEGIFQKLESLIAV